LSIACPREVNDGINTETRKQLADTDTRKGLPPETRTFVTKADAERWGRSIESAIDKGVYTSRTLAEQTTLAEIVDR
jgi:hypothetical protein